jgi:outer membrane protein assembly factor BamB
MNLDFNSKIKVITLVLMLGIISFLAEIKPQVENNAEIKFSEPKLIHTITKNSQMKLLWTKPIFTLGSSFGNACYAFNNVVYIIGSEKSQERLKLIALNSSNGETLWTKENVSGFTHSDDQLFTYSGRTLQSLSPLDGKENWSITLWGIRTIYRIFYFEDLLFISGSGLPFMVVNPEDGKIKSEYLSVDGFREIYSTIPFFPSSSEPFESIIINDDVISTSGNISFSITRWHIDPFIRYWEIKDRSISNSTLISNKLLYISNEDKIIAVDVDSGEELFSEEIEPSIGFNDYQNNTQHDGYYVCSDDKRNLLFIILGDSRQLFAFSLTNKSNE